jgi:uncharacterized membrane protein YeiH
MEMILIADLLGTFAFSVTGIIGGVRHQIDIVGAFFLAFVTAMGGGIIRDMVLGVPSSTFQEPWHTSTVILGVVFTYLFVDKIQKRYELFIYLDALGLSVFTVIGVKTAISLDVHFLGAILAGTLTAVGGGIIRDALIRDIPLIFHREIYAMSSLIGGIFFYAAYRWELMSLSWNVFLSSAIVFLLRIWGRHKNINMPRFSR